MMEKEILTVTIPVEEYKELLLAKQALQEQNSILLWEIPRKLDQLLDLIKQNLARIEDSKAEPEAEAAQK